MRKVNPLAVLFLFFGLFLFVGDWYIKNHVAKKTPEKVTKSVEMTGTVEVRQEVLHFQIPGKVGEILVSVGDQVEKDQTLARLENQELVDEVAQLKTKMQEAEAELETLMSGLSPKSAAPTPAVKKSALVKSKEDQEKERQEEIAVAEAAVARARDEMESMRLEVERYEKQFKEGTAPEKELFKAKSDFETAKAQVKEAEDMLRLVMETPVLEPPPPTKVALVKADPKITLTPAKTGGPNDEVQLRLTQTKAALAQAEEKLRLAEVVAPFSGYVMERSLQPGEFVVSGTQVLTLGKLDTVWVWGYLDAEDGAAVKKGMDVLVSSRSLQEKVFTGQVVHVTAPEAAPADADKAGKYHVKVAIPNPEVHLQPEMKVNVKIEVN